MANLEQNHIYSRIKIARKLAGYSQKEFANLLHIGSRSLSYYEKGVYTPNLIVLESIAKLCNVNYNWLVTGAGEMLNNTVKETTQEYKSSEGNLNISIPSILNELKELKAEIYDCRKENEELKIQLAEVKKERELLLQQNALLQRFVPATAVEIANLKNRNKLKD